MSWSLVRILQNQPPQWKPYSVATLRTALKQKQPVLVSIYANWDISSVSHELTAINSIDAYRFIRAHGLVTLRADLTNYDPVVVQLLRDHGLVSVPAFLLFHPAFPNDPIILKDLVSQEQLFRAIRSNAERSNEQIDVPK